MSEDGKMAGVSLYYPGFTRKAVTFTIDDGNIEWDRKFIDIVKPHGIFGTFNLCSDKVMAGNADFYRSFYRGFEIANHCKYHPYATDDAIKYRYASAEDKAAALPDATVLYPCDRAEGLYDVLYERGWRQTADTENYIRFADEGRRELEAVFGKGSVDSYVWPYGQQNNEAVFEHLKNAGYYGIRKTGCVLDTTSFAPPADYFAWSYNADNRNLLGVMEKYEAYPDDGELKFFAFGVHSWDFERDGNWDDLKCFAERYGDRPGDFWYASVKDIFEYVSASKELRLNDGVLTNPSDKDIFFEYNGKRGVVPARSSLQAE